MRLDEDVAVAPVAQDVAHARGAETVGIRRVGIFCEEAPDVVDHAPEGWLRQVGGLSQEATSTRGAGILETSVTDRDRKGHLAGVGRDAKVPQERGQMRIVLFVEDDEARVHGRRIRRRLDVDGVAVAAQPGVGFPKRHTMAV